MLASYLIKPGVVELREIPVPVPSHGEVVISIRAALTCGTDLKAFLRGHPMIPMPGMFGHEFSGIVSKTGKGVRKFKEGDEVMGVHSAPCRVCGYCRKRLFNLCENIMATKTLGAFAEFMLLPAHIVRQNLFLKPSHLSFEKAAFLEPLSCVVHGMGKLPIGNRDKVLIIGTGPIGLLHLLLAKKKNAEVIIADIEPERLTIAKNIGADVSVMPDDMLLAVKEFTDGLGVDYVFECTGQVSVWESAVNYARRGGTIILFGGSKPGTSVKYDTYRLHYDEIMVKGVFHFTPADVRGAYKLLDNYLNVSPLISGNYPLKDLPIALERLSRRKGIKYAIIP